MFVLSFIPSFPIILAISVCCFHISFRASCQLKILLGLISIGIKSIGKFEADIS